MDWRKFAKNHPDDPVEHQSKFHEKSVQYDKVRKNVSKIVYFCSDNDFYISKDVPAKDNECLKADLRILPGRNHFSAQHGNAYTFPELFEEIVGMNPWPVGLIPVPEKDLPVELPKVENYKPTGTGQSPLAAIEKWVNTKCPKCGGPARRETNTMPQWAGSNWYFLRYLDPKNDKQLTDPKKIKKWMPVDLYIGGAEHAVLHLLYARFIYKFLYDIKVIPKECGDEPFKKLKNQGIILGEDGQKMSKSRGNVINPDEVIEKYGADTMRMYEMFMGPFEDPKRWSTKGIIGTYRLLNRVRVWSLSLIELYKDKPQLKDLHPGIIRQLHLTIKKVSEDIENFKFNTAIAQLMSYVKKVAYVGGRSYPVDLVLKPDELKIFLKLLSPFAPHITEYLWQLLHGRDPFAKDFVFKREYSITQEKWPAFNESKIKEDKVVFVIQVNGKLRDNIVVPVETTEEEVKRLALMQDKVKKYVTGEPKKVIFIKGRLINFVV
jgi:leucyl-tRNA synthetase